MTSAAKFKSALAVVILALGAICLRPANIPAAGSHREDTVDAIVAPANPLPPESESRNVTRFSFILYGDNRGGMDGIAPDPNHARVVDAIIGEVKALQSSDSPVRFILQTGDLVTVGEVAREWNVSFVPLIDHLVGETRLPYFLVPGNHDVSPAQVTVPPKERSGLSYLLEAVKLQIPPDGSPRRLAGYATYAIGYGNTFVIGLDSIHASDDKQYVWVKNQLEQLDRTRYVNVFVFCHHSAFSSGPHSVILDDATRVIRARYLPLFHAHHIRAVLSGHEHLYEHWVEHYTDNQGLQRMDYIVSGGGGAPRYGYAGEPDLSEYLAANRGSKDQLQHLVKPGTFAHLTPHHFIVIHVDGQHVSLEFHPVDAKTNFHPYPGDRTDLQDPAPTP
jgi:hypothetical protein